MSEDPATSSGDSILRRDLDTRRKYVKYYRLLDKASQEGRIDGKYRCPICGMRFMTIDEAAACCNLADNVA